MEQLLSLLSMLLGFFAFGYVNSSKDMSKEEKGLREDIDSLRDEMKSVSAEAKENGWNEELSNKHENLYNQIEAKRNEIAAIQREEDVDADLENEATPVNEVKDVVTKNEYEKEKDLYQNTATILTTLASRGMPEQQKLDKITEAQKNLFKAGHYDDYANSVDAFQTLTDADGGIFLPTTVADKIYDIAEEYGVFSRFGLRMPMSTADGAKKIPNLLGQLTFYAVNEGSEAKASKLTFSGIELTMKKWMTYIPWTNEMDSAQGRRLVNILLQKLGEAVARMRDEAVVNADGTSDYHNLVGIVERGGSADYPEVSESSAATGNTSFGDVDPDDILSATLDIAKTLRERIRIAMDPDWRVYLKQMKDGNNIPYYRGGDGVISVSDGQYYIHGYPVDFTEAIPSTDGSGKTYAIMYVPEYYAFGDDGQFVIEQFNTGQIPNTDGTSDAINLLSQDMKAARVKTFFDFELSQLTKDSKGAFTVLKTA